MINDESIGPETGSGQTDGPPHGLTDDEQTRKDRSYSPASEAETAAKQHDAAEGEVSPSDVDPDQVKLPPGTGGPDDVGDVDADPGDIDVPRMDGAR